MVPPYKRYLLLTMLMLSSLWRFHENNIPYSMICLIRVYFRASNYVQRFNLQKKYHVQIDHYVINCAKLTYCIYFFNKLFFPHNNHATCTCIWYSTFGTIKPVLY